MEVLLCSSAWGTQPVVAGGLSHVGHDDERSHINFIPTIEKKYAMEFLLYDKKTQEKHFGSDQAPHSKWGKVL